MLREYPLVTVEVFDAVLAFAIHGFVEFFPDPRAPIDCVPVVGVDVVKDDGKHLGAGPHGCGGFPVWSRA